MSRLPIAPHVVPATLTEFLNTGLAGLEPTTYGLGNRRSIRLSYSPTGMNYAHEALWTLKAGEVIAIACLPQTCSKQAIEESPGSPMAKLAG